MVNPTDLEMFRVVSRHWRVRVAKSVCMFSRSVSQSVVLFFLSRKFSVLKGVIEEKCRPVLHVLNDYSLCLSKTLRAWIPVMFVGYRTLDQLVSSCGTPSKAEQRRFGKNLVDLMILRLILFHDSLALLCFHTIANNNYWSVCAFWREVLLWCLYLNHNITKLCI